MGCNTQDTLPLKPNSVRYLACDGETSLGVAVKHDVAGSGGRERGGKMQPFVWNVLQPKQNKQHPNYSTGSPKVGPAKHFEGIGLCFRRLSLANVKTVKVYRELVGTGRLMPNLRQTWRLTGG